MNFQLKYLPGNIYTNSFASAFAEIFGIFAGGVIYKKKGIKAAFCFLYLSSVVGGFLIMFFGSSHLSLMPIFVIFARIGSSGAFNIVYIANQDVFPTLFKGSAMGFCNFFSRMFCTLAPQIAERANPLPMIVFCTLNISAIVAIQYVSANKVTKI